MSNKETAVCSSTPKILGSSQAESKSKEVYATPECQSEPLKKVEIPKDCVLIQRKLFSDSCAEQLSEKQHKNGEKQKNSKDKSEGNEIEYLRAEIKQLEKEEEELELKLKAKEEDLKIEESYMSQFLDSSELDLSFLIDSVNGEQSLNELREESPNRESDNWTQKDSEVEQDMEKWLKSRQKVTKEEFIAYSPACPTEETRNQLEIFTYEKVGQEQICLSCLSTLDCGSQCVYLPCSHIFHAECGQKIHRFLRYCPGCTNRLVPASY